MKMIKSSHFVAICRQLHESPEATQRELAKSAGLSLGAVNAIIKECMALGYLRQDGTRQLLLTEAGQAELEKYRVKNAIILAAGFGSRFVPLTFETPKGLLSVHGQPMIERQIEQLLEKGIKEIIIVVGYKKESFDYLIDKYGVKLVCNPEYAVKNNLSSLYYARKWLSHSYILMSDIWIEDNIFNLYEADSWYSSLYHEGTTNEWCVTASPTDKINSIKIGGSDSWVMVGPAFIDSSIMESLSSHLIEYYKKPGTDDFYWEQILIENLKSMPIYMNKQTGNVHEFENLEELRLFDHSYNDASNSKIMIAIAKAFNVKESEIQNIKPIKVGMTNHSFTFTHKGTKYIMRVPGEGTDKMIDRKQEYNVYQIISKLNISDDVVCIDPDTGYKITKYLEHARVCDPESITDVKACMKKLREFHEMKLTVEHEFDIFERIEYYESLWLKPESCFRDYKDTKTNIMSLKSIVDAMEKEHVLTHIDAVPDNFLFDSADNGEQRIRLIDWEYSAMQDPHVDIAMFAVYSMYEREQIEPLIDSYFPEGCPDTVRYKIYAYIAMCGLLWSNWCEYKSHLGVEFGEYSLRQYRFAKDYYRIFKDGKSLL